MAAAEQQPTDNIKQEKESRRAGSFKEPKIKWKDSKAKLLLYRELTAAISQGCKGFKWLLHGATDC
jgi:hypothetical protein